MGKLLLFVFYLMALAAFTGLLMAIYQHYKNKNKNKK